ncbi:hypothetical protein D3C85_250290 [compost metagenome]
MKKIILSALLFGAFQFGNAQEIGVRFGDVARNNVALDAVFGTGKFNRIHADVSFGGDGVGVDALWDFIYKPLGGESFNWYLGVGPSMSIDDDFWFGVSGEIGLEYRFKGAPIALGIDYRPTFWIVEESDFNAGGFGFNARYIF